MKLELEIQTFSRKTSIDIGTLKNSLSQMFKMDRFWNIDTPSLQKTLEKSIDGFPKEIPVIYSEFKFKHPDMFRFSPDIRGGISGRTIRGGEASHDYTFDYETTTFIYENLPALDREAFVFNLDNLKASIRFELMQFAHAGHMSENYATSWEQIGKDLMRHSNFGGQLAGNNF